MELDVITRCFLSTRFKVYSWISMDLFWKRASAVQCTMTTNHEKLNSWRPLNHRFLCRYFELLIPIMKFSSSHNKQKVAKPKFCSKLIINDLNRCNFKRRGLKSDPGILPNSFFTIIRENIILSIVISWVAQNIENNCDFHEILIFERHEKTPVWNKWGVGAISRLLISDQGEQTWLVWVGAKTFLLGIILHKNENVKEKLKDNMIMY